MTHRILRKDFYIETGLVEFHIEIPKHATILSLFNRKESLRIYYMVDNGKDSEELGDYELKLILTDEEFKPTGWTFHGTVEFFDWNFVVHVFGRWQP